MEDLAGAVARGAAGAAATGAARTGTAGAAPAGAGAVTGVGAAPTARQAGDCQLRRRALDEHPPADGRHGGHPRVSSVRVGVCSLLEPSSKAAGGGGGGGNGPVGGRLGPGPYLTPQKSEPGTQVPSGLYFKMR